MMIIDVSIVALSFFLPFDGDMEARIQSRTQTIIYGWLAIYIYSWLADRYIDKGKQTIQFIILSEKWETIAYRITHETGRGVSMWDGTGYWTGEPYGAGRMMSTRFCASSKRLMRMLMLQIRASEVYMATASTG